MFPCPEMAQPPVDPPLETHDHTRLQGLGPRYDTDGAYFHWIGRQLQLHHDGIPGLHPERLGAAGGVTDALDANLIEPAPGKDDVEPASRVRDRPPDHVPRRCLHEYGRPGHTLPRYLISGAALKERLSRDWHGQSRRAEPREH